MLRSFDKPDLFGFTRRSHNHKRISSEIELTNCRELSMERVFGNPESNDKSKGAVCPVDDVGTEILSEFRRRLVLEEGIIDRFEISQTRGTDKFEN